MLHNWRFIEIYVFYQLFVVKKMKTIYPLSF